MLSDKIKDYLNEYISQEVYVQVAVAKGKAREKMIRTFLLLRLNSF